IEDQRHQRFGDVAAAELAEMPALVRLVTVGVGLFCHGHACSARRLAERPGLVQKEGILNARCPDRNIYDVYLQLFENNSARTGLALEFGNSNTRCASTVFGRLSMVCQKTTI